MTDQTFDVTQRYSPEVEVRADGSKAQGSVTHGYAALRRNADLKPFEFQRRDPQPDDVSIEILYCGVCHSDLHQIQNDWSNTVWPCVPGHEIVGRVTATGSSVSKYKIGDMVGVGCMVDSCQHCDACKEGEEQYCENGYLGTYNGPFKPDGSNTFGGYSDHIVVREQFVLRIPDNLDITKVAPILCAGVTTYSPLKKWKVGPGTKVGIVALGGLGHMAVQLAAAMGADVTVFTTKKAKETDAPKLGAKQVVLSSDKKAMQELEGSLDFILSTIPEKHDVNPYIQLLKKDGHIVLVGALTPLEPVNNMMMAKERLSMSGSLIGSVAETQEVLDFCGQHGITVWAEMIDMKDINKAFKRMEKEEIHYRAIIDMDSLRREQSA